MTKTYLSEDTVIGPKDEMGQREHEGAKEAPFGLYLASDTGELFEGTGSSFEKLSQLGVLSTAIKDLWQTASIRTPAQAAGGDTIEIPIVADLHWTESENAHLRYWVAVWILDGAVDGDDTDYVSATIVERDGSGVPVPGDPVSTINIEPGIGGHAAFTPMPLFHGQNDDGSLIPYDAGVYLHMYTLRLEQHGAGRAVPTGTLCLAYEFVDAPQ